MRFCLREQFYPSISPNGPGVNLVPRALSVFQNGGVEKRVAPPF